MSAEGGILHQIRVKLAGTDELSSVLKKATGSVETFKRAADQMKSTGLKFMGAGIALTTMLASAVVPATTLEESLANLASVSTLPMDGSIRDIKQGMLEAKKVALDWSSSHVQSAKQVTDSMYDLASAGLTVVEVNQVVGQTMALASATRAEGTEASAMMAKALNTFGKTQLANLPISERANVILNAFASVVKNCKTTLPELGAALKAVMGTASNAGLTIQETAAAVGLLQTRGLPAEQSGTALSAVLRQLPTAAKELGIKVEDATGRLLPLSDVVAQLTARYAENGLSVSEMAEIQKVFGDEAGRGIQLLIGQEGALRDLTAAAGDSNAAWNMLALQEDSFGAQLKIAWNNIKNAATVLGDAMLPELRKAAEWLGRTARGLREFAEQHPALVKVAAIMGMAAAASLTMGGGALYMAGTAASSVASILSMSAAVSKAGGLMTMLGSGVKVLGGMLSFLISPVGLVILAVVALGAGIYLLYKKSETFRNLVQRMLASIKAALRPVIELIAYAAGYVMGDLGEAFAEVKKTAIEVWPMIRQVLGVVGKFLYAYMVPAFSFLKGYIVFSWGVLKTVTVAAWSYIKLTVVTVWNVLKNAIKIAWALISGIIKTGLQILTGDWSGAWETIKQTFASVWDGIKGILEAVFGWFAGLGDIFYNAGAGLIDALKNGILASWDSLKEGVTKVLGWLRDLLPGSDAKAGPLADLTASGKAFFPTFTQGMNQGANTPGREVESALARVDLAPKQVELPRSPYRERASTTNTSSLVVQRGAIVINVNGAAEAAEDLEAKLEELFARMNRRWGAAHA